MMHVRVNTYPDQSITFTSPHGVVVTIPVQLSKGGDATGLEFDVPDLTSITVTGVITSVTGGE